MGREARVIAEIGEWLGEGKLLLETDELIFRGAKRHVVRLADITSITEKDGWLTVVTDNAEARFDLGHYAAKWLHAIRNPRTRIDKFDVKAGSRVALVDVPDMAFVEEVTARAAAVTRGTVADVSSAPVTDGDPAEDDTAGDEAAEDEAAAAYDILLFGAASPDALNDLARLRPLMKSSGAIWVIHPKGRSDLSHDAIMAVAKPLGLIDVKSARFDEQHGALKLMLPRAARDDG